MSAKSVRSDFWNNCSIWFYWRKSSGVGLVQRICRFNDVHQVLTLAKREAGMSSRQGRIHVVVVFAIGIAALMIAYIAVPVVAMGFLEMPSASNDADAMIESFTSAAEVAKVGNQVSLVALMVAGASFLYLVFYGACSFIGPRKTTDQCGAEAV